MCVCVCMCLLGSEDSHWLAGKGAPFSGVFHPSTIPDLHTCEAGQWQLQNTKLQHNYHSDIYSLLFISIIYYHQRSTSSLLPTPLIQHLSFIFLTLAFAAFHSTCTAICLLTLLFFIHTLRLQGSFINSTTPYSSKKKGGERVDWREGCPYWLTDCCMARAPWKLKTANAEAERRGGFGSRGR